MNGAEPMAGGGSNVFTYGSLMFPAVWTRVVSASYRSVAATLPGFRRQRVRGEDYPALERVAKEDRRATVDGILYLDVSPGDLALLDAFEGEDYRRIEATVAVAPLAVAPPAAADSVAPGPVAVQTCRPAGAAVMLPAQVYLFVASAKVEAGEWDPAEFERERIERFLRTYPMPAARERRGTR